MRHAGGRREVAFRETSCDLLHEQIRVEPGGNGVVAEVGQAVDVAKGLGALHLQLSGKGLARCRAIFLGPFPVPPHRNCTCGFPAYSSPSELHLKGYESSGAHSCFHAYEVAVPRGWSFQSQYRPRTPYRYSLLHRRQPTLVFRLRFLRVRKVRTFISR